MNAIRSILRRLNRDPFFMWAFPVLVLATLATIVLCILLGCASREPDRSVPGRAIPPANQDDGPPRDWSRERHLWVRDDWAEWLRLFGRKA